MKDTTIDQYDEIFYGSQSNHVINSMGIDYNYNITLKNFETGIRRALKNNEVLVLHAHKIDTIAANYTISPDYLENIFKLCNQYKIKSIRIEDLGHYFKHH